MFKPTIENLDENVGLVSVASLKFVEKNHLYYYTTL